MLDVFLRENKVLIYSTKESRQPLSQSKQRHGSLWPLTWTLMLEKIQAVKRNGDMKWSKTRVSRLAFIRRKAHHSNSVSPDHRDRQGSKQSLHSLDVSQVNKCDMSIFISSMVGTPSSTVTLTTQASYFTLTMIWKRVVWSFWCVVSIPRPRKTFHNAAIWGQCWPPWSQHRQMDYIYTSGGRGTERQKTEKQDNLLKQPRDEGLCERAWQEEENTNSGQIQERP